jgi:hypothetical protein
VRGTIRKSRIEVNKSIAAIVCLRVGAVRDSKARTLRLVEFERQKGKDHEDMALFEASTRKIRIGIKIKEGLKRWRTAQWRRREQKWKVKTEAMMGREDGKGRKLALDRREKD